MGYANMPLPLSVAAGWFDVEPHHAGIQTLIKSPKLNRARNSQTGSAATCNFRASGNENFCTTGKESDKQCGANGFPTSSRRTARADNSWLSTLGEDDRQSCGDNFIGYKHVKVVRSDTSWLSYLGSAWDTQPPEDHRCCRKRRHHGMKRSSESLDSPSCDTASSNAESRSDSLVRCNFRTPTSADWTGGVLGEANIDRAHTAPSDLADSKVRLFDLTVNDYDDYEADFFPGKDQNRCNRQAN